MIVLSLSNNSFITHMSENEMHTNDVGYLEIHALSDYWWPMQLANFITDNFPLNLLLLTCE